MSESTGSKMIKTGSQLTDFAFKKLNDKSTMIHFIIMLIIGVIIFSGFAYVYSKMSLNARNCSNLASIYDLY